MSYWILAASVYALIGFAIGAVAVHVYGGNDDLDDGMVLFAFTLAWVPLAVTFAAVAPFVAASRLIRRI